MSVESTRGQTYRVRYKYYGENNHRHVAEMVAVYLGPDEIGGEVFSLRPIAGTVVIREKDVLDMDPAPHDPIMAPVRLSS